MPTTYAEYCTSTHLFKRSLEEPIKLTAYYWEVGGNWETRKTPTWRQGEHAQAVIFHVFISSLFLSLSYILSYQMQEGLL